MFDTPIDWGEVFSMESFYTGTYHILLLLGSFYMYFSMKGNIPAKHQPCNHSEKYSVYLVDAWIIEHSVYLVAYTLALVYGRSELGRFCALLLFSDMVLSYAFIPVLTIRSHRTVCLPDLLCNITLNTLIAVSMSTYLIYFAEDRYLLMIEIFNVIIGFGLFFIGIKKRLANYNLVQHFPFTDDNRIMGAPDFYYVTSPDQFGELLQWIGFHIICGSTVSMGLALYKCQVAIGKAFVRHKWYLGNNRFYPKERRVIIPHLI